MQRKSTGNNIWRILSGLAVLVCCWACGEKIPEGIIPVKQMPSVLLDIHLADGQLASLPIDSARGYRDGYYEAIFNHHGVDSMMFRRSVEFYTKRPYLLNDIYARVEKQLNAWNMEEQRKEEEKYTMQRQADSLVRARQMDSLARIERDSLDFKRKRYLLYVELPDSTGIGPTPVTHEQLHDHLAEMIHPVAPPKSVQDTVLQPVK